MEQFRRRGDYRWRIVSVSFIAIALSFGTRFTFSVFFNSFLEEFSGSRAKIAGIFSISLMVTGLASPLVGWLIDRFGCRKIMTAGAVLMMMGLMASGSAGDLWHLYVSFGIIAGFGINTLGMIPQSVTVSNWFPQRRGMYMGIITAGIGIGLMVMGPLAQRMILAFGWRGAFRGLALIVGLTLIPMVAFLYRDRPMDLGLELESESPPAAVSTDGEGGVSVEAPQWTVRRAARTPVFWLLFIGWTFMPVAIMGVMAHHVVFLVDVGFDKLRAATAFGSLGLLSSGGRVFFGYLSDRIGRVRAVMLSFLASGAGIVALLSIRGPEDALPLYLFIILFGLAFGARGPVLAVMVSEIYGGNRIGSIYGTLSMGVGIGGPLGPWLLGLIYDRYGSYFLSFQIAVCAVAIAALCFGTAGYLQHRGRV